MEISILGPGCSSCGKLEEEVKELLKAAGMDAEIKIITDVKQIIGAGITRTPGLAINGKVKSFGRIPKPEEIKRWIEEENRIPSPG